MTNKELRKLTREDLLELLLEQAEADEKRQGETDRLTALNQSLESEKDHLTQELDACRADLEKVGQTADALKEELAGAKEAAVETETLRAEIDHLREENDSLRQELECLHQEGWQSSEKDRQFLADLVAAGKRFQQRAEELERENDRLRGIIRV